jgi:site-specific recombinase XerC
MESKGRKSSRVIWMGTEAQEIAAAAAAAYPEGPIFRDKRGRPWHKGSTRSRFRAAAPKLGMEKLNMTLLRHSFAHHRLTTGQDSMVVTELLGHKGPRMLKERYGHLSANARFMAAAADFSKTSET